MKEIALAGKQRFIYKSVNDFIKLIIHSKLLKPPQQTLLRVIQTGSLGYAREKPSLPLLINVNFKIINHIS